jgi:hypothetical protein
MNKIGRLTDELKRVVKDLERGFERYGEVLMELQRIGLPVQVLSNGRRERVRNGAIGRRGRGRPRRHRALSKQIVELLGQSKKRMKPRELVPIFKAKPTSVSTTLNRLSKTGRIKHDAKGWYV